MQVAFYGPTTNYEFIFERLGHHGTTPALCELQKAGDFAGMADVITDDILRHFTVEGTGRRSRTPSPTATPASPPAS